MGPAGARYTTLSCSLQQIHQLLGDQQRLLNTSNSAHWEVSNPCKHRLGQPSVLLQYISEQVETVSSYISFCVHNISFKNSHHLPEQQTLGHQRASGDPEEEEEDVLHWL